MQLSKILIRPLITEKSAADTSAENRYHFKVNVRATKNAIAQAVEELFVVDVIEVATHVMPGKKRRVGKTRQFIRTPKWKKAIVTLKSGQEIKYD